MTLGCTDGNLSDKELYKGISGRLKELYISRIDIKHNENLQKLMSSPRALRQSTIQQQQNTIITPTTEPQVKSISILTVKKFKECLPYLSCKELFDIQDIIVKEIAKKNLDNFIMRDDERSK